MLKTVGVVREREREREREVARNKPFNLWCQKSKKFI